MKIEKKSLGEGFLALYVLQIWTQNTFSQKNFFVFGFTIKHVNTKKFLSKNIYPCKNLATYHEN